MAEEFEINLDETIVEPAFSEFDDVLPFDNTPQKEGLGRKQIIILVSIGAAVLLGLIGLICSTSTLICLSLIQYVTFSCYISHLLYH